MGACICLAHFQSSPLEDRAQQTTPLAETDPFLQPSVGNDCLTQQNVYICNAARLQSTVPIGMNGNSLHSSKLKQSFIAKRSLGMVSLHDNGNFLLRLSGANTSAVMSPTGEQTHVLISRISLSMDN